MPKKCLHENCMTIPNFNIPTEKIALYCNIHKLENMINIKNKNCIYENCKTQSLYNFINEKTTLYCNIHKLEI